MKANLVLYMDSDLIARVRAEAARQRRPLAWVAADLLTAGLECHASAHVCATHTELSSGSRRPTKRGAAEVLP